jgi:hypothetical protein
MMPDIRDEMKEQGVSPADMSWPPITDASNWVYAIVYEDGVVRNKRGQFRKRHVEVVFPPESTSQKKE